MGSYPKSGPWGSATAFFVSIPANEHRGERLRGTPLLLFSHSREARFFQATTHLLRIRETGKWRGGMIAASRRPYFMQNLIHVDRSTLGKYSILQYYVNTLLLLQLRVKSIGFYEKIYNLEQQFVLVYLRHDFGEQARSLVRGHTRRYT